jgi:transmembrane sensor
MVQPNCMNQEEYLLLYEKYVAGLCSAEEQEKLYAYMDAFQMQEPNFKEPDLEEVHFKAQLFEKINSTIDRSARPAKPLYQFLKIAAVLLAMIGIGFLFIKRETYKLSNQEVALQKEARKNNLIHPGKNTATLTLSDGSVLDLERVKSGMIVSIPGTKVNKSVEGAIVYQVSGEESPVENMNTISVPAGGQYKVVLSDGTAVWLNALSKLTYPVIFKGKNREIMLTGEAYFEVAKDAKRPFIATVNTMKVTVLGTHFNINSYDANSYKTTLLEGAVRISNPFNQAVLKPGQQGIVIAKNSVIKVDKVNVNKVVSWKEGYFMFQDDHIKDIMSQISRWYDVDVEFRGSMPSQTFGGMYSRNKDINELLKGLELTGLVRFKIEGRRIIVMS